MFINYLNKNYIKTKDLVFIFLQKNKQHSKKKENGFMTSTSENFKKEKTQQLKNLIIFWKLLLHNPKKKNFKIKIILKLKKQNKICIRQKKIKFHLAK